MLINSLGLAVPIAMLQIFDRVIPNQSLGTLDGIMLVMFGVIALDAVLKIVRSRILLRAAEAQEREIAPLALDRLFRADLPALRKLGRAKLVDHLQAVQHLRNLFPRQRSILAVDLVFSLIYLTAIFALAGALVLVPLVLMAVVVAAALPLRSAQNRAVGEDRSLDQKGLSYLSQALRHTRAVKLWGAHLAVQKSYDGLHRQQARASATLSRISGIYYGLTVTLGPAATGMTSLFGGYLVMQQQIGLAELAACILLTGRATQPVFQTVFSSNEERLAKRTTRELRSFLWLPDAPSRGLPADPNQPGLELLDLSERDRFARVTLDAPKGALIVIQGRIGADPSALLEVVAGERAPSEGAIRIKGRIPRLSALSCEPRAMRFLQRKPLLFYGTLRENLTEFTEDKGKAAELVQRFGLGPELNAMPGGLDWVYQGSGTGGGSTGLFKKLNLAAAIAAQPELLLLEAPLVDLDPKSAATIAAEIIALRGETTILATAPSAALLEAADIVVTLHQNRPADVTHRAMGADLDAWVAETNGGTPTQIATREAS
ncbi:ABC transporter transmembrane domain-containing protein [Litoreibacter ponti]|uniref:ABC transporter transmembrane domain-containing protein n=1 Tax=Litoreibacter ponti TaxID=1510457 RepID=UPI001304D3F0|nr:ABC transporter transmembrane domain-containing protein [Litoreibacter ponti]